MCVCVSHCATSHSHFPSPSVKLLSAKPTPFFCVCGASVFLRLYVVHGKRFVCLNRQDEAHPLEKRGRERQGECQHDKWHKSNCEDCRLRKNDRAREKEKMRVRMKWKPILHLLSLCPVFCCCCSSSSVPNKGETTPLDLKGGPVL